MKMTALAFADDNNEFSNSTSHNLGSIDTLMAEKLKTSAFSKPVLRDLDANLNTVISTQAYQRAKSLCHQMAYDDPTTILKAIATLSPADQKSLGYLRKTAQRLNEISRRNQAGL